MLLSSTDDPRVRLGVIVYVVGLCSMLATSATYHRLVHGLSGVGLVGVVWSAAPLGAWCKLSRWGGGDRAGSGVYALTIVLGAVAVPWLWAREGSGPTVFVVVGGVVFTIVAAMAPFVAIWMLVTR